MSFRRLGFGVVICSALGFAGCEAPDDIVPVTAPGAPQVKTPIPGDEAQAQGETPPASKKVEAAEDKDFTPALPTAIGEKKTTKSGVVYETLKEGTGSELKPNQRAVVEYEGKLENGKIFDSSKNRAPGNFQISKGPGGIIVGWYEGLPGMKIGEKRKLTIPAKAAYGDTARPGIPANSTLIFEVELLEIR